MAFSDFPGGFADGVSIRNLPIVTTAPGKTVWLNNSTTLAPGAIAGSDQNKGTYRQPKATLTGAMTAVGGNTVAGSGSLGPIANRGDLILVMPNHAETVAAAAGINLSVAGVQVIGLANGVIRPTISFATATTATLRVSSANCLMKGFIFQCNIASQAMMLDVRGKDFTLEECRFQEGSAQALIHINVGNAANDSDRFSCYRSEFYGPTAAAASAIKLNKALIGVRIRDCKFSGDFSDSAIANPGSAAQTDLGIDNVTIRNAHAAAYGIRLQTVTGTGVVRNSSILCDTQANAASLGTVYADNVKWGDITSSNKGMVDANSLVADSGVASEIVTALGTDGTTVTDSATTALGAVGANNAANAFSSASVVTTRPTGSVLERLAHVGASVRNGTGTAVASNKSLVDAIGSDGTTISYGSGNANAGVGSTYMFKKTLTSSAVTQAGVLAVTATGALSIEQITVQSNSTGLAAGTNFTLTHNNASGLLVFAGAAVSALNGNKTVALTAGAQPNMVPFTNLETGSTVTAKCTVADCTGAGTIDVYFICRRITAGALLS